MMKLLKRVNYRWMYEGEEAGWWSFMRNGLQAETPLAVSGAGAANADTSGAALVALEVELNELKALLRSLGLMAV